MPDDHSPSTSVGLPPDWQPAPDDVVKPTDQMRAAWPLVFDQRLASPDEERRRWVGYLAHLQTVIGKQHTLQDTLTTLVIQQGERLDRCEALLEKVTALLERQPLPSAP
jgi:hypothetical protein